MYRLTHAVLLLAVAGSLACKKDPEPAPEPSHSAPQSATPAAPPGHPPTTGAPAAPFAHGTDPKLAQTPPRALEKLADGRTQLGPFTLQVPADWTEKPSASGMRAAQYQLPAPPGGEAEVVVYYFGERGAGDVQANVDRWVNQFKQPDDKPSKDVAKVEKAQLAGQESTLVSVSGRYVASAMPGGPAQDKPDQSLLAAIVPSPKGPYYFRLIGSTAAVEAQTGSFRKMLESLKL
jgi:hypothetical protein